MRIKCIQEERVHNETYKDNQQAGVKEGRKEFRLRRMPGIMPIGVQNELYRGKPEVRKEITFAIN